MYYIQLSNSKSARQHTWSCQPEYLSVSAWCITSCIFLFFLNWDLSHTLYLDTFKFLDVYIPRHNLPTFSDYLSTKILFLKKVSTGTNTVSGFYIILIVLVSKQYKYYNLHHWLILSSYTFFSSLIRSISWWFPPCLVMRVYALK